MLPAFEKISRIIFTANRNKPSKNLEEMKFPPNSTQRPHRRHIPANLLAQLGGRGKFTLFTQLGTKLHLQFAAIKFADKIQQVRLHA